MTDSLTPSTKVRSLPTLLKALSYSLVLAALISSVLAVVVRSQAYDVIDFEGACSFLEKQYVPEIGLLRAAASPGFEDYYRVYINDNILAAEALAVCGNKELAIKIRATLKKVYEEHLRTGRHEVLIGEPIDGIPRLRHDEVLGTYGDMVVLAEVESSEVESNWREYADWLLLEAINSLTKGDGISAMAFLDQAMRMWDGNGFSDLAYKKEGRYATYKLALAIYTYRALGEPPEYREAISRGALEIISAAQDPTTGGIRTDYTIRGKGPDFMGSGVNVETTSATILALYSSYPSTLSNRFRDPLATHNLLLIATMMAATAALTLSICMRLHPSTD